MKLATFCTAQGGDQRVGALILVNGEEYLVDLLKAYSSYLAESVNDPFAAEIAAVRIPGDMCGFLRGGQLSLEAAKQGFGFVESRMAQPLRLESAIENAIISKLDKIRILPPISKPGKIISTGGNYQLHIDKDIESNKLFKSIPDHPIQFLKSPSSVIGNEDPIIKSRFTDELDYEIELAIVIGKRCKDVTADNWLDYVAGFTVVNDVSMRDIILKELDTGSVFYGKSMDSCCPMGPYLVTKDEIQNADNLEMQLSVNGDVRQKDNTKNKRFSCGEILAFTSRITLEPGDIITTGTPTGVAGFRKNKPHYLLKDGDVVEAFIEGIGQLTNYVIDEEVRTDNINGLASNKD
jgi:acylpyruvate hydrolase